MSITATRRTALVPEFAFTFDSGINVCPACGKTFDACLGHRIGLSVLVNHSADRHGDCHPRSWCRPRPLTELDEHVKRGAVVMDDIQPAWFFMVDGTLLDLADGDACVIGQYVGKTTDCRSPFDVGLEEIIVPKAAPLMPNIITIATADCTDRDDIRHEIGHTVGVACGMIAQRSCEWPILTDLWSAQIERRLIEEGVKW